MSIPVRSVLLVEAILDFALLQPVRKWFNVITGSILQQQRFLAWASSRISFFLACSHYITPTGGGGVFFSGNMALYEDSVVAGLQK